VTDYESLLLLDPDLPDEGQEQVVARTRELIEKGGGTVDRHDVWGRRKLAYEIAKKGDGSYHLLTFSSDPETLDELSRVLKIDETVLRHLVTRRLETGPGAPVAVGVVAGDDADDIGPELEEEE
jgi:small subunit ribosomal protein S6